MTGNKYSGMLKKAALAASLAAGAVLPLASTGCRAAYVRESAQDRAHYQEVYKNTELRGYNPFAASLDSFIGDENSDNPEEGTAVAAGPDPNGFDKYIGQLGEAYPIAQRAYDSNQLLIKTLSLADEAVRSTYGLANEEIGAEKYTEIVKSYADSMNELKYTLTDGVLTFDDLTKLKEKAVSSGDQNLIKQVDDLIASLKDNSGAMKSRVIGEEAIRVAEGMYDQRMADLEDLGDALEGILTGVPYTKIENKAFARCASGNTLEKKLRYFDDVMKDIAGHVKRNGSMDRDYIVRTHRFDILRNLNAWGSYIDGEGSGNARGLTGKELDAVVNKIDTAIAGKYVNIDKDGMLKNGAKMAGWIVFPWCKLGETGSFLGADDLMKNFVSKEYPDANVEEAVMDYAGLIRLGATNGGHVVGNKAAIGGEFAVYAFESAGWLCVAINPDGIKNLLNPAEEESAAGLTGTPPDPTPW